MRDKSTGTGVEKETIPDGWECLTGLFEMLLLRLGGREDRGLRKEIVLLVPRLVLREERGVTTTSRQSIADIINCDPWKPAFLQKSSQLISGPPKTSKFLWEKHEELQNDGQFLMVVVGGRRGHRPSR